MLKEEASHLPCNKKGPILGLQFGYCDNIVAQIRAKLGTHLLIEMASQLDNEPLCHINVQAMDALEKLFDIGNMLQALETTSGMKLNSRGINAGLILVIQKFAPSHYNKSIARMQQTPDAGNTLGGEKTSYYDEMAVCPFLNGRLKEKTIENPHLQVEVTTESKKKTRLGAGVVSLQKR